MLGAVGAYGWTGTVVHQTAGKSKTFPKNAFEKTLDDRNHSSLLGETALCRTFNCNDFSLPKANIDVMYVYIHIQAIGFF